MCVFCRAFEAIYQVPVEVATDPARQGQYDAIVIGGGKRGQGERAACAEDDCDLKLMGGRVARQLGMPDLWEYCETHGRQRAARRADA